MTMFNQQTADAVCELLADGKSLRAACEELGVKRTTIHDWARDVKEFSDQYARAREIGYKLLADQILEIADTPLLGVETKIKDDGSREVTEGDMLGHRKLQVDSRKWMLSKMLPKIYGDKLEIGSDPEKPFKLEFGWKQSA